MRHGPLGWIIETMFNKVDESFWYKKNVFVTGHTGFKGSWLIAWLNILGANVKGFALQPQTAPSLFNEAKLYQDVNSEIANIQDLNSLTSSLCDFDPEIVLHLAAQPIVSAAYSNPVDNFNTNIMGTVNLFEALRSCKNLSSIINVTTDKVYENKEWYWSYRENDILGGADPYSCSKSCSELITNSYLKSFFNNGEHVGIASARAGNVIGGGDWAQNRLIPDVIRCVQKSEVLKIRNPNATRPWQHVLEPLSGYLMLAEKLSTDSRNFSSAWNFGPSNDDVKSVRSIVNYVIDKHCPDLEVEIDNDPDFKENQLLHLDINKSRNSLNWAPKIQLNDALDSIFDFHNELSKGEKAKELMYKEIEKFME